MNELADVPASMFALINFPSWEIVIKSTIVIALAALACQVTASAVSGAAPSRLGVRAGGVACCANGLLVIAAVQAPSAAEHHGCLQVGDNARFQAAISNEYRGIVLAWFGWRNHHQQRLSAT